MNIEDLRKAIEVEQQVHHWGDDETITPRFVEESLGDGKRLLAFIPLNTRPNYYVIRMDSAVDLNDDAFYDDYLDDIYAAISSEYGEKVCGDEECGNDCHKCDRGWPILNGNCGSCWGELTWPALVKEATNA